jgi:hypothetical protein
MYLQTCTVYFLRTEHKTVLWSLHLLTLKALFESVWLYVVIHQRGVIAWFVRLQQEFSIREDTQCTHNVIFKRVRVTIVAVEKQLVQHYIRCECVCSLSYPARKAHAPCYIVICGLSSSTALFHIIPYMTRFSQKVIKHKMCFDFLYNFCLKYLSF